MDTKIVYPKLRNVTATDNFELVLKYANDETRVYDFKKHLEHKFYKELSNLELFKQVLNNNGIVEWATGQDFCPHTLYEMSFKIPVEAFSMDNKMFFPEVLQVVPTDDFKVYCYFNDGSIRLFDVKPLIKDDTVFEPLKDINFFKEKLTVMNGTVAWDIGGNRNVEKCLDLDPFTIFEQPRVCDPLAE